MADPTPADVQRFIAQGLACEHLEVEGDGRHFFATIVSTEFEGVSRVLRHQRVYQALGDRMREQIHALSMKTLTPAEWASTSAATLEETPGRPQVSSTPSGGLTPSGRFGGGPHH